MPVNFRPSILEFTTSSHLILGISRFGRDKLLGNHYSTYLTAQNPLSAVNLHLQSMSEYIELIIRQQMIFKKCNINLI